VKTRYPAVIALYLGLEIVARMRAGDASGSRTRIRRETCWCWWRPTDRC